MQPASEQKQTLNCEEIAKAAWHIWQQEGCPQGRDLEHWLKAEQQLLAARSKQSGGARDAAAKRKASPAAAKRSAARKSVFALKP